MRRVAVAGWLAWQTGAAIFHSIAAPRLGGSPLNEIAQSLSPFLKEPTKLSGTPQVTGFKALEDGREFSISSLEADGGGP